MDTRGVQKNKNVELALTVFPFHYHVSDTKKNVRPVGHLEGLPLAPLKMALTPLKVKKKIAWINEGFKKTKMLN